MGKQLILLFIILIGIFSCGNKNQLGEIQNIIIEVESKYAPDSRTAIFNVRPENNSPIIISGETNIENAKLSLLNRIQAIKIPIKDVITLLPDKSVGDKQFAIVNVSVANLRSNPKHSAELASQAILGTPLNVLKNQSGWLLVQTPDKYIAWTNSGSLTLMDNNQFSNWKNRPKIIYLNTYGYSMNETNTQRVSDLISGNILALDHETETHFVVNYPDGRTALVKKNEAEILNNWYGQLSTSGGSISNTAKDMIGIPYLWGGTSTKGLDCSGFTKTVYFLHGLVIPRDASQQVHSGKLVDKTKDFAQLQPGDLLFFGRKNEDQTEKVVHVGMWLGNNQFIHASGDVHISSTDSLDENFDRYNYNRYLRSKRVVVENPALIQRIQDVY